MEQFAAQKCFTGGVTLAWQGDKVANRTGSQELLLKAFFFILTKKRVYYDNNKKKIHRRSVILYI